MALDNLQNNFERAKVDVFTVRVLLIKCLDVLSSELLNWLKLRWNDCLTH